MRKSFGLLLPFVLVLPSLSAQDTQIQMQRQEARRGPDAPPEAKKQLTPEQRERAMQLLDGAEAGARGLDPGSRAYALIQVARAYTSTDKKKAVELLEEALAAAREVGKENERLKRVGSQLQEQALQAMVPLAPKEAEDLLAQLDAREREQVLNALLDYYQREKKMDHALEIVYRMGQEGEIPYGAASRIMERMTPEQAAEKQQLFTVALASYRDHDHSEGGISFGDADFPNMIVRFSRDLPPGLIHQGIEVTLDVARKAAEDQAKHSSPTTISIGSAQGAVQMSSIYQYRLFQLLPVLRTIDPDEADRLLKEQTDVQTLLAKYPQGMNSIAPEMAGPGEGKGRGRGAGSTFMATSSGPSGAAPRPGPDTGGPGGPNPMEMQRAAKIAEDADKHPQDALANAAALQDAGVRTNTYLSIAQATWKKQPSVAHQALEKAADAVDKLGGEMQVMQYRQLVQLYMRMGAYDDARKYIEKGMDAASKIFRVDTNADDPNQAPKAYWPSVAGWRSMLTLASQISPLYAATLLKEIPDEQARTIAQLGIATALLQAEPGRTEIMSFTKDSGRVMFTSDEQRDQ